MIILKCMHHGVVFLSCILNFFPICVILLVAAYCVCRFVMLNLIVLHLDPLTGSGDGSIYAWSVRSGKEV